MNLLEIIKDLCSRPLVTAGVALCLGILAGDGGGGLFIIFSGLILLFGFAAYSKPPNTRVKSKRLVIIFLVVLSYLTGIFRYRDTFILNDDVKFPDKALKETYIEGEITDISYGKEQYILILDDPIIKLKSDETDTVLPTGKVMVYSDCMPGIVGDKVSAKGALYSFAQATNYGQFDQREYYLARGIVLKLYADEVKLIEETGSIKGIVKSTLFDISGSFQDGLDCVFDEKDRGILYAMLAGNRSELDDSTKGLYQRMGIAHVLSISGLHITLIGLGLYKVLMLLKKRLKLSVLTSCTFVFLYGMLTGFSVSTQRAVIMLFCMLFARLLGEAYDGQSAAGLAAIIILVMNPAEIYDSGFQLSFIAVFGIFAGNEIRRRLKIKSAILIYLIPAISAQIATFPLILRSYYSFSPYSIIANILLVPLMPVIVGSGFLAGILAACGMAFSSGALMTLAEISAGPAHYMLLGYEKVSLFLQDLPGADVVTGCPELWKCLVYYTGLFLLVYMSGRSFLLNGGYSKILNIYHEKNNKNQFSKALLYKGEVIRYGNSHPQKVGNSTIYAIMFSITMVLILILLVFRPENSGLNVSFIDVGQGLSIYIEADGRHILADGGSSNVKSVGKYRIEPFLLWSGVKEIDYCFVSHTDEDHISGIRELMEEGRIKIDTLVVGVNYEEDEPLIALAHEKGIKVIKVEAGDIINNNVDLFSDKVVDNSGDLSMRVLSPDSGFIYEDKNQASLVAEFEYGNLSMLFTGDSDMYAESEYVSHLSGDKINILQCPHHGSKYSSSELLLETIRPDITVISCSKNNVYGHPARETLERLEAVGSRCYITSQDGMVTVKYDGDNTFTVDCYKISNRN